MDLWTSIDILEELVPIRHNLSGVSIEWGRSSISAFNFTGSSQFPIAGYFLFLVLHFFTNNLSYDLLVTGDHRNVRLLDTSYEKVMNLLFHNDMTFIASVRQKPSNVGTLFSITEGFTRYRAFGFDSLFSLVIQCLFLGQIDRLST